MTTGYFKAAEPECVFVYVCDGIMHVSLDVKRSSAAGMDFGYQAPMQNVKH